MNILFLGGDKRYKFIMQKLATSNHFIYQIGFENFNENIHEEKIENLNLTKFDYVFFPMAGLSDTLEIKSELGLIKLPQDIFKSIGTQTKFFTGVKTKKILELIPNDKILSFLDFEEVKKKNNSLTIRRYFG